MRPLLDFDDAGAQDDHPARGVTCGDIRAWHDEREEWRATLTSIAKNTCCDRCREAAKWASAALNIQERASADD